MIQQTEGSGPALWRMAAPCRLRAGRLRAVVCAPSFARSRLSAARNARHLRAGRLRARSVDWLVLLCLPSSYDQTANSCMMGRPILFALWCVLLFLFAYYKPIVYIYLLFRQPETSKTKYMRLNRRLQALVPSYGNIPLLEYLKGIAHNISICYWRHKHYVGLLCSHFVENIYT